jgi:hypothetical protein
LLWLPFVHDTWTMLLEITGKRYSIGWVGRWVDRDLKVVGGGRGRGAYRKAANDSV